MTTDAVERALLLAPDDDEPDSDDDDGGLTEARQELARGEGISTEELRRELRLGSLCLLLRDGETDTRAAWEAASARSGKGRG